jgi:uncharacterized membrane protein
LRSVLVVLAFVPNFHLLELFCLWLMSVLRALFLFSTIDKTRPRSIRGWPCSLQTCQVCQT